MKGAEKTTQEGARKQALPTGLPHVAYVALWFPLFTQPFIFREVEGLAENLPLKVYTLYGQNLRFCSGEMKKAASCAQNYGMRAIPALFCELAREACARPRRFFGLLRRSLVKPWKSLETFGENLWAFCAGIRLGRQFVEDGIDMAYAPWPRGAATAAWVASEIAGIPFATSARGDNLDPVDPDLVDKLNAALFIRANNRADMERIKKLGIADAGQKTDLVYNSLTLPEAPDICEKKSGPGRILALGRFDVTKGFDVLLEACAILKKRGTPFFLTLAGGGGKSLGLGNQEKALRELREKLDLENEVAMPGLVSHDDLPAMLMENDIFAAPCVIHSSGRRDGIPNTVIEAMAYGLPVVATSVNALPEAVLNGESGFTVEPQNARELADALETLLRDPALREKMGEAGKRLAHERFDPAKNSRALADIFVSRYRARRKHGAEPKCAP